MDKDNVPQDKGGLEWVKKVVYATDKDGNYTKAHTCGWEPENVALNQAWEVINEKVEEARKKVQEGKVSPIAYHMEKNMMDESLVSDYMGISKRKVVKHLDPKEFNKLSEDTLKAYARVFKITIEQLIKTD
ncbi:MAG: hypothetical protein ACK40G_14110 [Cytophagaceae bacterium]